MADSPNTTTTSKTHSRREMLALAGGLAAATAAAGAVAIQAARAGQHPDAELLDLRKKFDKQLAIVLRWREEEARLEPIFEAEIKRRNTPITPQLEEWFEVRKEVGFENAIARVNDESEVLDKITTKIRAIPASTFAGLAVKVWAVAFDTYAIFHFDEPEDDMDWTPKCYLQLLREADRLAAAEAVS